jgi:hypothetical protein
MNERIGASFRPQVNEWMELPKGFWSFSIHHPSRRPLASLLGLLVGYSVGTVLLQHKLSLSLSLFSR